MTVSQSGATRCFKCIIMSCRPAYMQCSYPCISWGSRWAMQKPCHGCRYLEWGIPLLVCAIEHRVKALSWKIKISLFQCGLFKLPPVSCILHLQQLWWISCVTKAKLQYRGTAFFVVTDIQLIVIHPLRNCILMLHRNTAANNIDVTIRV